MKIVAAEILEISQHPNADRLSVVQVKVKDVQILQIVCGAKNFQVGDKVPCALHGSKLPDQTKIKRSKMRGVETQGMLCSREELGLPQVEGEEGLMILPRETAIGMVIYDHLAVVPATGETLEQPAAIGKISGVQAPGL